MIPILITLLSCTLLYFLLKFIGHFPEPPEGISIENKEYSAQQDKEKYLKLRSRIEKGREQLLISEIGTWNSNKSGAYTLISSIRDGKNLFLTYKRANYNFGISIYDATELSILYFKPTKEGYYSCIEDDKIFTTFWFKNRGSKDKEIIGDNEKLVFVRYDDEARLNK